MLTYSSPDRRRSKGNTHRCMWEGSKHFKISWKARRQGLKVRCKVGTGSRVPGLVTVSAQQILAPWSTARAGLGSGQVLPRCLTQISGAFSLNVLPAPPSSRYCSVFQTQGSLCFFLGQVKKAGVYTAPPRSSRHFPTGP